MLSCPRFFARLVELPRQRPVQDVVDQRALARAGDSGDHGHDIQREARRMFLRLWLRAPSMVIQLPVSGRGPWPRQIASLS